jgi:hypothetical protein
MADTTWEQKAGMTSATDVDNVETLVDQAETSATSAAASATAAAASASSSSTYAALSASSASAAASSAAAAADSAQDAADFVSGAGVMLSSNNLSDVDDAAAARTNLGLGTAAITDSGDYATSAQGALADSALQPGDNISALINDSGFTNNSGTVTSVDIAAGSGLSASGGPITSSGSITVGIDATVATLTGTQTLTNKTLTAPAISTPTMTGTIVEDVYALSGTSVSIDPDNGSVQTHTLTANTTYSDGFSEGEAITLMIDDGSAYTITWPTMTWVNNGGSAPTLADTGYTVVALWKVSTTLYGALVGDGS